MPSNIDHYPDQHPVPRQNRSHTAIPTATSGTADYPPGALAAHIKRLNYNEARFYNDGQLKSDALEVMNLMPAKRDPILRPETAWSGATLDQIISERIENIESALMQVVGVPAEQPCIPCQRGHGPWNTCVVLEGNSDLTACAGCRFGGNDIRCTHYQPLHPDKTERECRDREIEDLREDIDWLQKRITESNVAIDETRQTMRVLREATQRNMAANDTHQTMKVLAETVQFHNREVSQARVDNELLHQRHQELCRLIHHAGQLQ